MSRIGKQPVEIPAKTKVEVKGQAVRVEGPKGTLEWVVPSPIKVEVKDGKIIASDTPAALAARVTTARVSLTFDTDLEKAISYATEHGLTFVATNTGIAVETPEHNVAALLVHMARAHITYTTIVIEKPTLEDYFLHIAQHPSSQPVERKQ